LGIVFGPCSVSVGPWSL